MNLSMKHKQSHINIEIRHVVAKRGMSGGEID